MGALYGRALARDFLDIDAAITSGRYSQARLLELASAAKTGFDRARFALPGRRRSDHQLTTARPRIRGAFIRSARFVHSRSLQIFVQSEYDHPERGP
jgi:hypothetical protein